MNVTDYVAGQKLDQHYGLEHVALNTDDFDNILQRIKSQGTTILEERTTPNGGRIFFFEGPEGTRMEIMESVAS